MSGPDREEIWSLYRRGHVSAALALDVFRLSKVELWRCVEERAASAARSYAIVFSLSFAMSGVFLYVGLVGLNIGAWVMSSIFLVQGVLFLRSFLSAVSRRRKYALLLMEELSREVMES